MCWFGFSCALKSVVYDWQLTIDSIWWMKIVENLYCEFNSFKLMRTSESIFDRSLIESSVAIASVSTKFSKCIRFKYRWTRRFERSKSTTSFLLIYRQRCSFAGSSLMAVSCGCWRVVQFVLASRNKRFSIRIRGNFQVGDHYWQT